MMSLSFTDNLQLAFNRTTNASQVNSTVVFTFQTNRPALVSFRLVTNVEVVRHGYMQAG